MANLLGVVIAQTEEARLLPVAAVAVVAEAAHVVVAAETELAAET